MHKVRGLFLRGTCLVLFWVTGGMLFAKATRHYIITGYDSAVGNPHQMATYYAHVGAVINAQAEESDYYYSDSSGPWNWLKDSAFLTNAYQINITQDGFYGIDAWKDYGFVVQFTGTITSVPYVDDGSVFNVYPNPAVSSATVYIALSNISKVNLQLISLSGAELYTQRWEHAGVIEQQLPIGDLAPGIYIVELSVDNKRRILQIVKQ